MEETQEVVSITRTIFRNPEEEVDVVNGISCNCENSSLDPLMLLCDGPSTPPAIGS